MEIKEKPIILAIESSTQMASVAVCEGSRLLAEESSFRQKSHSEFINPAIGRVLEKAHLKLSDIDCIGVSPGPGSFTGVRVSANIAKTLAFVLKRPLVSVSSLEILAYQVGPSSRTLAMINAFKDMIYYGVFENKTSVFRELVPPSLMPISELGKHLTTDVICVGDGFGTYSTRWSSDVLAHLKRPSAEVSDFPLAKTLCLLAHQRFLGGSTLEWNQVLPLYLKASEAEENLRKGLLKSVRNF